MRFTLSKLVALFSVSVLLLAAAPSAAAQSGGWQMGPGAILDNTYAGAIDTPQNGASVPGSGSFPVAGWFVDKQAEGWAGYDDAEVWLGSMDGGGHFLARAVIQESRPDVAAALGNPFFAASGFTANVPGSSVPSGNQTLYVYVHTGGKGWWYMTVNVVGGGSGGGTAPAPSASGASPPVLKFINPLAEENVSTRSSYVINGSVNDPSNVDHIEVWINGERNTQHGTLLGTTTPNSDGSWSVTFLPTRFPSTHTNLYAYAHNKATGLETEAIVGINIVDR